MREWGRPGDPIIFMLHGWSDVSATFQFVIDALSSNWRVIAPDLRGFGLSVRDAPIYWYQEYLADLDALLEHYSPNHAVRLVGHSMGGNVAALYAGVRPHRVKDLVGIEAHGLPDSSPEKAPERLAIWLDRIHCGHVRAERGHRDIDSFVARMMEANPRLRRDRAHFLAQHLTEPSQDGGVRLAMAPAHRNVNPVLYRRSEAEHCWCRIRARVLWLVQQGEHWRRARGISDELVARARDCISDLSEVAIADAGHNLHHDQPEQVARAMEAFFDC